MDEKCQFLSLHASYLPIQVLKTSLYQTGFFCHKGTFINDVPRFLAISDLPTYLVLLYNVPFLGLSWTPLPTLIRDIINERSRSHCVKLQSPIRLKLLRYKARRIKTALQSVQNVPKNSLKICSKNHKKNH